MKTQNMFTWTAALRDPESKQTKATLTEERDGALYHCCLGLGCIVAGVQHERDEVPAEDEDEYGPNGYGPCAPKIEHRYGVAGSKDLPPHEFHDWLGLVGGEDEADIWLDWPDEYATLTEQGQEWQYADDAPKSPRLQRLASAAMTCVNMNDSFGLTFPQIADMVDYFGIRLPVRH